MASSIYELIGRVVVRLAWARFGAQVKVAGGVLAALGVLAIYLLGKREPPEG
jgi:hypothetical protein